MKVLHVISSGGMYGAEAVILHLSRSLNGAEDEDGRRLHLSMLAAFTGPGQSNAELFAAAGRMQVQAHALACTGPLDSGLPTRLRKLVEQTGADIVHAHGYKADIYGYLALRNSEVALVSTCHTWYDNDLALRLYGVLDRFVLRRFQRVAAVSDEVRQSLLLADVSADHVRLIRNGIEIPPFPATDRSREGTPLRVGLVGRLAPEKGIDLFIRAAARVLADLPEAQFDVVGEGPARPELERLITELNLGERLTLSGRREDMEVFYESLALLVSSSRQEGLPLALLEGMASGLAVVATSVGAVSHLVQNGQTGLLVRPDSVVLLAEAITALLLDPARREQFGKAGRARVAKEFSAQHMADEYLVMYGEALAEFRALRANH